MRIDQVGGVLDHFMLFLAINVRLKSLVGKRQTQHVFCTGLAVTVVGQPIENAPFAEGISGAVSLRV